MITLCRAEARHHDRYRTRDAWFTFAPTNRTMWFADGFGLLESVGEHRLPPGGAVPRPPHCAVDAAAEIVTYVREGALAYEDSIGGSAVIHAGEFQRMTTGRTVRHYEANASRSDWAHVFQIWLRISAPGVEPGREQRRFSAAERRGGLCIVASPDARRHSLRLHQDALLYSALLEPGQHVAHELAPERAAWLHLVRGAASVGDIILTDGDGVGFEAERAVSLTAREPTELLLADLRERARGP